jgi:hypothetical protein
LIPTCEVCGSGTIYELKYGKYDTVCSKCLARLNPLVMQVAKMRQSGLLFNLTLGIAEHMVLSQFKDCGWFLRHKIFNKVHSLYKEVYVFEFHEPRACAKVPMDTRDFKGHKLSCETIKCKKCKIQRERAGVLHGK